MKRRVISLLAILAMLCTMVVVVAPTATAAEWDSYPSFSTYTADSSERNWKISVKADWEKVREVANAATSDYLSGYTLHLANDLDFQFSKTLPIGNTATNGAAFAGTLNGHGFGFNNANLGTSSNTLDDTQFYSAGLFFRLGNCEFIDVGINSGLVYDKSGNVASGISSFGRVMPGKTPKFTRVWSSATIASMGKGIGSGLVHTIDRNKITVEVNGFVFDGEIIKNDALNVDGQWSYAVSGAAVTTLSSGNSFANIVTDFASRNGIVTPGSGKTVNYTETQTPDQETTPGVRAALFNFDTVANFNAANQGNIYAVKRAEKGINDGYFLNFRSGYGGSGSEELMTDMSAVEAAWTINNNQISGKEAVYYTLNSDGKVRPIPAGAQTGKIVKITLTGVRNESYFFNAGTSVNLASDLGKTSGQTFTANGSAISSTTYTVNADTEITVTASCGDNHTYDSNSYVAGTNEHTKTCTVCGVKTVEPCSATSYTQSSVNASKLAAGEKATHSGTCQYCGQSFTQECIVEYKTSDQKDNGWTYSNCPCKRKTVTHTDNRLMRPGDCDGDKSVTAKDAIMALKKIAKKTVSGSYYKYNADVDANSGLNVQDVRNIILFWLGDDTTQTTMKATAARVNVLNYYNAENVEVGNLKMDGSEGNNDRYLRTDNIVVTKGNRIVFGPVRMQQAVMGWFYKADGTPLAVINRNNTNLKLVHEFADADGMLKEADLTDAGGTVHDESLGMVMVRIDAPTDAAYVRFNINAEEEEKFYIRMNNEFNVGVYEAFSGGDIDTLGNPLKNQFVLNMGDSLSDGSGHFPLRDPTPDGRLTCWSRRTKQQFNAKVITSAKGGSTVSTIKYQKSAPDPNGDLRDCILNQLNEHSNSGRQFEYILLEGGGNDAGGGATLGTFKADDYNPANFAPVNTYSGALERLIYTAIQQHGDTAAFAYFVPYDMRHPSKAYSTLTGAGTYFDRCKEICAKWGIPVCDLFYISHEDENGNLVFDSRMNTEKATEYFGDKYSEQVPNPDVDTSATGLTYDGCHALDAGHDIMFTYIKPYMLKMQPVSAEIYAQVQEYHKTNPLPTSYLSYE